MKKFTWKAMALMLVMAIALTGCFSKGKGPDKAPDVVVKEAMQNLSKVKSMEMLASADVNVKAVDKEKAGFEKANFNGTFNMNFDVKDAKVPKFSMKIDGKGSQNGEKEESAAGEVRLVGNTLYASLTNLSDFKGTVPMAMVQPYFGKWWSIALPEEFTKDLSVYSKDEKDLTPEEKKLKDIYSGKDLFTNVKYEGNEEVDGTATYAYSAELDKEEVKALVKEMSVAQGQPLSEEEIKKMDDAWKSLTLTAKLYVDQKNMTMKEMAAKMTLKDLEGADVEADLIFTYRNLGGDVVVEVPKDATPFDLGAMFGGLGAPGLSPDLAEPDSIPVTPTE